MKCPFCGEEMERGNLYTSGGIGLIYLPAGKRPSNLLNTAKSVEKRAASPWMAPIAAGSTIRSFRHFPAVPAGRSSWIIERQYEENDQKTVYHLFVLYAFGLRRRPGLAAVPALDGRCIHQLGDSPRLAAGDRPVECWAHSGHCCGASEAERRAAAADDPPVCGAVPLPGV